MCRASLRIEILNKSSKTIDSFPKRSEALRVCANGGYCFPDPLVNNENDRCLVSPPHVNQSGKKRLFVMLVLGGGGEIGKFMKQKKPKSTLKIKIPFPPPHQFPIPPPTFTSSLKTAE